MQTQQTAIILASSSPYRAKLLQQIIANFQCISPDINEERKPNEHPKDLAKRLSLEKAKAVAKNHSGLIIASDQVASCHGEVLNKPGTFANAVTQLQKQSGQWVHFHTGLCLINTHSGQCYLKVVDFSVRFKSLSLAQITAYLNKEDALDCAGSFKAEGLGAALFTESQGQDPNSLIGLPLYTLSQWLRQESFDPLLM